jgi:hypothetical protein
MVRDDGSEGGIPRACLRASYELTGSASVSRAGVGVSRIRRRLPNLVKGSVGADDVPPYVEGLTASWEGVAVLADGDSET